MSDQKTHADIIAEMRGIRVREFQDYADRIEAAHRREVATTKESLAVGNSGDCAKLREALVQVQKKINYLIGNLTVPNSLVANRMEINGIINAALAAPPRNCDVGTAEELAQRFYSFCTEHSSAIQGMCDCKCPCIDSGDKCHCLCKWMQMPYKEGGAK